MKERMRNKFTAILVAIAMFVAGIFAFGNIKTRTAKADSGTTYKGNDIDDIAASFMFEALNHFGVSEGSWILLDDQILGADGAWESLLTSIIDLMGLTPASNSDSDRLLAIADAEVNILKVADDGIWDIANGNLNDLWEKAGDPSSEIPHVCGIGIWQLNMGALAYFIELHNALTGNHETFLPIYVIEREEIIFGDGGLVLWVYDEVNGGFWLTTDGRPEWWID